MKLVYTVEIAEDICEIDGLHTDLDNFIEALGFSVQKSTLESPDEITDHEHERSETNE